jgi:hypothetical protein
MSGQLHATAVFTRYERILGTHCVGGWVGPSAGLDHWVTTLFSSVGRLTIAVGGCSLL